ncbi:beta-lactamase [Luteipulveratus mongoliensis]|uniref:Beta-lactamase n=2 Tax=Luteipulveratus mongoliensis TaxID=571913 RepID=A0A0K1JPT1_9MICO|nr:beta-lactamase [Luteipulveratus mongoliensis]
MDNESKRGIDRRRLLGWSGLAAAGAVAGPLLGSESAHAATKLDTAYDKVPPATRPGGAYDRYVAQLAAEGKFSGVVMLSHRGRTVLSRSYGMADREKKIRIHEGTAFNLSSAGKPFHAVAILQLAQEGKLNLWDTVGAHLKGFDKDIAEQVTIHHMLSGTSGMNSPDEDLDRITNSREEVQADNEKWSRQSKLAAPVGTPTEHAGSEVGILSLIVESVSGMSYWDYVEKHVFRRCGMTGTAFYTRAQWLTDEHIAHSYMRIADGSSVDAVRNLDKGSPDPYQLGKNAARSFIAPPGDAGFATAPDLVRFANALYDGTALDPHYNELFVGPKVVHRPQGGGLAAHAGAKSVPADASFGSYSLPVSIVQGQWLVGRAGVNPGSFASWNIYPDSGWVGVILGNDDNAPFIDIINQEMAAILGTT